MRIVPLNKKQIVAALVARKINHDANASDDILDAQLKASWLSVCNKSESPGYDFEMTISGTIGTDFYGDQGYSARQFEDELKPLKGKRGLLNIHSGGGNVWDGFAISEMVRTHGLIDTKVLGLAASAADVIFQAGAKRIMPQMAMRMGHCASALFSVAGNAKELGQAKSELDKTIARLEKHDGTLANMYAKRSGQSLDAVKADMEAEEFMDGDESLAKGYCDELTSDTPVVDQIELAHLKKIPAAVLNQFSAPLQGGQTKKNKEKEKLMNRKQMEALLNSWGVKFTNETTDDQLVALVTAGKPVTPPANVVSLEQFNALKAAMDLQNSNARKQTLRTQITQFASEDRIPVNQIEPWVEMAMLAADDPVKGNAIVSQLRELPAVKPGVQPVASIEIGSEDLTMNRLDKVVCDLLKPSRHVSNNRIATPNDETRRDIAAGSRKISSLINRMKKFDGKGQLIGPIRDAWDAWANGVSNANTMSTDLLRQIILSEHMRQFRREFTTLSGVFSHNFKDVALQGTDKVEVPYYPLDTVSSTEFKQADGYVVAANAQTLSKEIIVGGKGDGAASAGRGRKYKPLQFSAYEIARQPWLNIAQLIVMAAEQLAVDVKNDILGAHIKAANFGNAIWQGASGAFDKAVFNTYLLNAAIKAYWPKAMRACVLTPDFYTALLGDPGLQQVLAAGTDESLRDAVISRLLSFSYVGYDAGLPVTSYIRGGDGTATPGADLNLAGFIAYPSAILIATAPVMPGPATMRLLASYEQVTDDQTGLTFSYQYFGNVLGSSDNEIIECSYGSGLGELAALKRIVTAGV